ncbi:hypothetical protein SAMD00019534_120400 [Acytostelium subglobosum LB1]|uniref:hypothetical protein n=1 Tax=Acytostelium subglobosum LB1 TaxID=1410327 RepID=UPI000644B3F3|nr:hypothetical protein SAMD00019534_120400 [Acytostelium subglobosum LB1]GAM28864.1 hypothetical protein SAMD00019534_120400 [Acytostelium subglobosum LB1]|eukprot:XP_012748236.1 hypothetical protein SAMD00019534_120400 [Acytostelium subglobosum LB1]
MQQQQLQQQQQQNIQLPVPVKQLSKRQLMDETYVDRLVFEKEPNNLLRDGQLVGYEQEVRIRTQVSVNGGRNFVYMVDRLNKPTIILMIDVIRGQLSLYTNDLVRFTSYVNLTDWTRGLLVDHIDSLPIPLDDTVYPFNYNGLRRHMDIKTPFLVFSSLSIVEYDIIEQVLKRQGLVVDESQYIFDMLTMTLDELRGKLPQLKAMVEGNEGQIQEEEAGIIDSYWAYRSAVSMEFMRWTTKHSLTSCKRVGVDMVSWIIQYSDGSIGNLFTPSEHRKRGYAKSVVADLLIRMLEKGDAQPYLYIKTDNTESQALFRSLGFHATNLARWLEVSAAPVPLPIVDSSPVALTQQDNLQP